MKNKISSEEKIISQNHAADVAGGMSEQDASESDAFERRVLGIPDDEPEEDHGSPDFVRGRCTRCKRTAAYCEC